MRAAKTRYAKSGDVHIAYQVLGNGPIDVVFVQGFISNLEVQWEEPGLAHLLDRLAAFGRLILFDKRGSGLSDRVAEMPPLETRMDDVRAVMDAAGSRRAALLGTSEGGSMSMLFAATYPERTRALVLYGAYAQFLTSVQTRAQVDAFIASADREWGTGASLHSFAPGMLDNARFAEWWARFERLGATPAAAMQLARMNAEIDVRSVLPTIRVPTLVIHRRNDFRVPLAAGRYLADHIAGARYVEVEGSDHPLWVGETDAIVDEIAAFLTGVRPAEPDHRALATILAIDIADAHHLEAERGDRRWADGMQRFHAIVATQMARFAGRELDTGRAGTLAVFDGPSRAVRCALAVRGACDALGWALHAGVHTGEVEMRGEAVGGMAVAIATRIAAAARPGDVLVSATVRDLVIGAPLGFAERGDCALEGVAGRIRLLVATDREPMPARPATASMLDVLSRREHEILTLVAQGLTNPEIAASLALSEHTVKRHVANLLSKLELPTRTAAAAALAGQRARG
jgi:pimeloyl-ACP methyl ester carboxylesterase/DNA-binding CsgD family transcriptional regulator